ncbi:MAG: DUF5610 domain-containing protein [Nitrospinae bacterium]|nr:DUF5610 domain-containing protein [Nitrospinota bacterium]
MTSIEPGGVRPSSEGKVNLYDLKELKSGQGQGKSETPAKSDSVQLDNVIQKLVEKLRSFFSSGKMAKDQFAQSISEISIRANVKQTFEGSIQSQGADGSKVSAYYQQTTEASVQIDIRMKQAVDVAEAQAAAMEANPYSPEATAQRITDFALSFFPMFASQRKDLSYEEQVDEYQKMVEGAVDKGFKEALQILGDLPTEVADGVNKTKDLVSQSLSAFFDFMRANPQESKDAASGGVWKNFVDDFFATRREEAQASAGNEEAQEKGLKDNEQVEGQAG